MTVVTDTIVFFSARTTDATSTAYPFMFPNKRGQFCAYGTWNGATMTLYYSPDGGTTYIIAKDSLGNNIALTADGSVIIDAPVGELMRCILSNDGASTSLSAEIKVL